MTDGKTRGGIDVSLHGDVLAIVIDNPPVNALGSDVRARLGHAFEAATADPEVRAIVVAGAGKLFSGGADIAEFGRPFTDPTLPDLLDTIEACPKPVVAAIRGTCLGGGLELALSCHWRVAAPSARLGLPEVKLGLLPGAGGTQRLPRLVGAEPALDIIVSGDPVTAERAHGLGLVDAIAGEDGLLDEAVAFARTRTGPRRTRDMTAAAEPGTFDAFVARNPRRFAGLDAPAACVEAVRAATTMPFREGQALERAAFLRLVAGDQSKALRHAFFAERAAARIDDLPRDTPVRPIRSVGIVGAGTMGGGIAMTFLSAGIPVTIVDADTAGLDRGVANVRRNYEASAAKGRLSTQAVERAMALLTPAADLAALADADLVIEAVYEDIDVKRDVFARLDAIARPGAILASNTSYQSVDDIAAATSRPGDVLGLHFFSPANVMRLLEVVRGARTAPDVLATAMALARTIGKTAVVSRVCYGFIGNRMLIPRQRQAEALLLEGATPEQVDRVHLEFGMPMGPFQMADLAGVDIGWHRDPDRIETLRDALCARNRWGQKTGAGFYDYDTARRRTPSEVVDGIVRDFRRRSGVAPRAIPDDEIIARTLYTMVNEGLRILEEGIAQRPSDIDVVWMQGYGWPRHTGGPMFWADAVGSDRIRDGLARYRDALGPDFRLADGLKSPADRAPAPARIDERLRQDERA